MGALHAGHISLVQEASKACDEVITSIFVNPTQFAEGEDLDQYPRDLDGDIKKLSSVPKLTTVFHPPIAEMFVLSKYPEDGAKVFVGLDELENSLREGQSRPGHFRGVATVVTKLFNLVQPHKPCFSSLKEGLLRPKGRGAVHRHQKADAASTAIAAAAAAAAAYTFRIVRELLMNTEVNVVPTMREEGVGPQTHHRSQLENEHCRQHAIMRNEAKNADGLAMSSRNLYLSAENRPFATTLYKALKAVEKAFSDGLRDAGRLLLLGEDMIQREEKVEFLYLDLCCMESGKQYKDGETLAEDAPVMLSGAMQLGKTRLIDNLILQK
eukprot:jgi/Bigna1/89448/estExt_fgenesh1_pg.C_490108